MEKLPDDVLDLIGSFMTVRHLQSAVAAMEQASRLLRRTCHRALWRLPCEALGLDVALDANAVELELGRGRSPW